MKNECQMIDLFQVEELEKRYEMGWRLKGTVYLGPVPVGEIEHQF